MEQHQKKICPRCRRAKDILLKLEASKWEMVCGMCFDDLATFKEMVEWQDEVQLAKRFLEVTSTPKRPWWKIW